MVGDTGTRIVSFFHRALTVMVIVCPDWSHVFGSLRTTYYSVGSWNIPAAVRGVSEKCKEKSYRPGRIESDQVVIFAKADYPCNLRSSLMRQPTGPSLSRFCVSFSSCVIPLVGEIT